MVLSRVFFYALVVLLFSGNAKCEDTYDIPVTFNPLIQSSVELGPTTKYFYDKDKPFYSNVTVIDAALDSETRVTDTIQKSITVVFLTTVSSHISKTLKLNHLRHIQKSKWSYTLNVQSIVDASNGNINKITDKTIIYRIQESAIKVLEKRYQFNVGEIVSELGLTTMTFYGVDEQQWIKVVGIITRKIINNRLTVLNLTSCYLAEMVNKTVTDMQAFTLNEVDEYLYNTSMLLDKLPAFQKTVVSSLYQTFNVTAEQLATMSDTDIAVINTKNLKDVLQLFTKSVLNELRLTVAQITESDPSFEEEMLLSCRDKWEPFRSLVISISFNNSAKNMSITSQKLASLINFSYTDIKKFTINQMLHILNGLIEPQQKDKKLVETSVLSDVISLRGTQTLNIKEHNAFAAIEIFTIFTQRQLTLLYNWTQQDYEFSSLYPLDDLNNVCSIKSDDYNLLELATINIGQVGNNFQCKSFNALREIWEKKSIRTLEEKFGELISLDKSISAAVSLLTNASSPINYRVLNITSKTEELIEEITFNNISSVTSFSNSYIKTMSFQDIIVHAVHLKQNGSFDHTVTVTTDVNSIIHSSIRSSTSVLSTLTATVATTQSSTPLFVSSSTPSATIVTGIIKTSSDIPNSSDFPSGISKTVSNPHLKTSSSSVLTSILQLSSSPVLLSSKSMTNVTAPVQQNASTPVTSSTTISNTANNSTRSSDKDDVPWIIYVVIAIMVVLIVFLIVVIIYCEKKHKKKHRPQVLDFHNGGINMYPRSTSYLAQTPESEADLADGLGIVYRHGPPPNMVTFNPTPEEKRELDLQNGQPGMLLSFKRIDPD